MATVNAKPRYLKVVISTIVGAAFIMGGVLGGIHAKDRIDLDIQKLMTSIQIAEAMHVKVVLHEGAIVMKRPGVSGERTFAVPTLKRVVYQGQRIQVAFQSFLFRKTIDIEVTDALKIPMPAEN